MSSPLSHDSITTNLRTRLVGREVVIYRRTGSTNDVAWRYAADKTKNGLAVFAEQQTAGRGREGSKWLGGDSQSILCSVLLINCQVCADLLTLAAGIAAATAIGRCGRHHARIRWPNDVLLGGRKVAGILIESKNVRRSAAYVMGIGINCSQSKKDFGEELARTAVSIEQETGASCDRNTLAKRLLLTLDECLIDAEKHPAKITEAWLELSCQLHQRLTLRHNNRTYTGNCIGIDPQKGLILQLDRGGIRIFDSAHTHNVRAV